MSGRFALLMAGCALLGAACGGGPEAAPPDRAAQARARAKKPKPVRQAGPLLAHRFAEVSDVIGPYVGRDGDAALAAWAEASGSGRTLYAAPIDGRGLPGEKVKLGNLAPELDLVLVRGLGAASKGMAGQPRFAVVTTRRAEQKSHVELTAVTASGSAAWGPSNVVERAARVLWVGFVIAGERPLLLWAEQAFSAKAGDPAALYGLAIAADAKPQPPQLIAGKACAWQAASSGSRAALASVKASGAACTTGTVTLDLLASSGKSEKSVDLGGRAALDLDLVGAPDTFVAAWSDHAQLEPRAVTAVVDPSGAVRAPAAPAVPAFGEQAVVALAPGASATAPAFLVWENIAERPESARSFEVSALNASGRASGAQARLLYGREDGGAPELTPFGSGLAALTLAPVCNVDQECESSLPVPTFVAFDAALRVQTSEPLVLDALGGRAADLGWGLTCFTQACFALAAPSRSPAALFTVPLPLRENQYRAAAEQTLPPSKPRVVESDVLARAASPLAHITLADQVGRRVLGYVTDFDPTTPWQKLTKPAEDGRFEPLRARVAVRAFASEGAAVNDGALAPLGEEQPISLRAHSLGGLSLLPDLANTKQLLAAWTGLDNGEPQVFLTTVGVDGKRLQQRMLTRKSGDASDVAGLSLEAAGGGGWLLAWVDERNRDAEVYAARISRTLEKVGTEQRITSADGAATELQLTWLAGKPYAVWADARAAEEPGWADIYGAFLRPSDAARDGAEHRLSSSRPHSFAPQVGALDTGAVVAWLEEAADSSPAGVRLANLAANGDISGTVLAVPLEAGAPRALGLECRGVTCRVVVTVESEGRAELYGFEWKPGANEPRLSRLMGLGGPGAAAVAPLVRGNRVYVADLRDGQGLVRRLGIEW